MKFMALEFFYSHEVVPLKSPTPPQEYLLFVPLHPPPEKRKFEHPCPVSTQYQHPHMRHQTRGKIVRGTTGVDLVDSHLQSTSGSRGGGGGGARAPLAYM